LCSMRFPRSLLSTQGSAQQVGCAQTGAQVGCGQTGPQVGWAQVGWAQPCRSHIAHDGLCASAVSPSPANVVSAILITRFLICLFITSSIMFHLQSMYWDSRALTCRADFQLRQCVCQPTTFLRLTNATAPTGGPSCNVGARSGSAVLREYVVCGL
jgi:hypothetical protein